MLIVGIGVLKMGISQKTLQEICDRAYPVGSYYFSNNSTSPVTLFGGTWTQISGYFVKAMNSSIGTTGGSSSQNVNFCPTHSHTISSHTHSCISHTHSINSINHYHSIGTHSHGSSTRNHGHSSQFLTSPNSTEAANGVSNGPYIWSGTYQEIRVSTYSTTITSVGNSQSFSVSGYLGSCVANSSNLNSIDLTSTSYGSSGSNISIMPPYKECYCWRRTG